MLCLLRVGMLRSGAKETIRLMSAEVSGLVAKKLYRGRTVRPSCYIIAMRATIQLRKGVPCWS